LWFPAAILKEAILIVKAAIVFAEYRGKESSDHKSKSTLFFVLHEGQNPR
jgi:hypothetical protein